jgi:glyoxylase-like metal-dependent hydrolase (beta-lactamase superfamily II)
VNRTLQDRQVAENVFVFEGTYVNWAIIADGTDLTLVDTGWHGDIQLLERSIRLLGRRPKDVRAVLLTHAHADHVGALNHLHDSYGIPLYMDPLEVPHARGEKVETATPIDVIKRLHRPRLCDGPSASPRSVPLITSNALRPNRSPLPARWICRADPFRYRRMAIPPVTLATTWPRLESC